MSDMRPRGIDYRLLDGVERHALFTLAVVDELQDKYDKPIGQIMALLASDRQVYTALADIVQALVNDEADRTGGQAMTGKEIRQAIDVPHARDLVKIVLQAYGYSMPPVDEDEEPEDLEDQEKLDIARLLYIGSKKLGYTEAELFAMTPKKFFKLFDVYIESTGAQKPESTIDALP